MTRTSYYELLDLSPNADAEAIRQAFREQARVWHPDRNPDDPNAAERFKAVNEAYRVLSDETTRAAYDHYGDVPAGSAYGVPHSLVRHSKLGSTIRRVARAARRAVARPGADIEMDVQLDFAAAVRGTTRVFELPRRVDGGPIHMRRFEVRVPPGVDDGKVLRWRGEGHPGDERARAGDLLVRVHVTPDPRFRREGADVFSSVTRPYVDFVEGARFATDTVYGPREVELAPGTQPGGTLRVLGAGVPGTPDGDHVVSLRVALPETLTEAQRTVLREIAEASS